MRLCCWPRFCIRASRERRGKTAQADSKSVEALAWLIEYGSTYCEIQPDKEETHSPVGLKVRGSHHIS
jgi:hypothetical protein